jgi:GYF domain 2
VNSDEVWYYLQLGVTMGPLSRPAIEDLIRRGTVARETLVWSGSGEWTAASSSALAPVFPVGGFVPPPPPPVPVPAARKNFLPQDPGRRSAVLVIIFLIGLVVVWRGIQQMREGMGAISGAEAAANFRGCRGVSASTVQCGYYNAGVAERRFCMDVVVICADGRHVAATCSEKMRPGESTTKLVDNFSPGITGEMSCSAMTYENLKAKG